MHMLPRIATAGLVLLVLLTTCSAPFGRSREPVLSRYVADNQAPAAGMPTVQPTVTPNPAAAPVATPALAVREPEPAVEPGPGGLAGVMIPAPAGPPVDEAKLVGAAQAMDGYLGGLTNAGAFRGSVFVAVGGRVLVSRGYGLANNDTGAPNTPQTRFRLASVSKPITAVAVLQLVADGRLRLEASVCEYLPNCPPAWTPVTVRHMLNHTAGLPNYTDFASFAQVEIFPAAPDQVIDRFRNLPLNFAPGAAVAYSNSGYVLLGKLIEQASGLSYAEYLRERIFLPLGMANSGYDTGDFSALNGTRGYAGGAAALALDTSNLYAAGGLYASTEDLYRLTLALDAGLLLPPDLLAQMYTAGSAGFGYGWKIESRFGRRAIHHPGYMSGAATFVVRYPDDGLTVIVLSNDEYANPIGIADELARIWFSS
jgi:CubicO group peptidase (beta-lactamase class C family)